MCDGERGGARVAGEARRRDPVHDQGVLRDAQEDARVVQGRAGGPRVRHARGLLGRALEAGGGGPVGDTWGFFVYLSQAVLG